MSDWIELHPGYSTTRRVRKVAPEVVEAELKAAQKPEDQFETILFQPEGEGRKGEGGLRTKGYFKKSSDKTPLVTVITVVFNGEAYLEETILCVINQTYANVEYIIIDGGSADGTLDIIKKYEYAIDYWVSEKDKGIYDAMNKALLTSTGSWINFMNSGDMFTEKKVLSKVFEISKKNDNVNIIYGSAIFSYGLVRYPRKLTKAYLFDTSICHQAIFSDIQLYRRFGLFSLNYKIISDRVWLFDVIRRGAKSRRTDLTICIFAPDGLCSSVLLKTQDERFFKAHHLTRKQVLVYSLLSFVRKVIRRIMSGNLAVPVFIKKAFYRCKKSISGKTS